MFDYLIRIFLIAIAVSWAASRRILHSIPHQTERIPSAFTVICVLVISQRLLFLFVETPLKEYQFAQAFFEFHRLENNILHWLDLTFGLALVAVSEEIVFRKIALKWLESWLKRPVTIIIISGLFFGASHWGSGFANVSSNFLYGAISMFLFMRSRQLWPQMVAHWLVNFIAFT